MKDDIWVFDFRLVSVLQHKQMKLYKQEKIILRDGLNVGINRIFCLYWNGEKNSVICWREFEHEISYVKFFLSYVGNLNSRKLKSL